jgi:hypothetical protein
LIGGINPAIALKEQLDLFVKGLEHVVIVVEMGRQVRTV